MQKRRSDLIDITGVKINHWTVIKHDDIKSKNRKTYWVCKCDCGTIRSVRADGLKTYKSCGCHKKQLLKDRAKHGQYQTKLYKRWIAIKQRCLNPNNSRYKAYGKRGISVCEEWLNFEIFYKWAIEQGYEESLTIDRVDNNGNYEPSNCRFISNKAQQLNKSNNRLVEIEGIIKTVKEWCDSYHINRNTFVWRLNNGWQGKKLLSKNS